MKSIAPYAFDSNNPISSSIAQQLTTSEAFMIQHVYLLATKLQTQNSSITPY
jgi:hypothetical protein